MLFSKRVINAHAFADPVSDGCIALAEVSAPVFEALRLIANRMKDGISSVINLVSSRSPLAVEGAVMTVIVYSIKGKTLWPFAHVGEERTKRIIPLSADHYPPASVVLVIGVMGLAASLFHRLPSLVFRGSGLPMLCVRLLAVTSARLGSAILKVLASYFAGIAALASALPEGSSLLVWRPAGNCEPAKRLPSYIDKIVCSHNCSYKVIKC